MVAYQFTLIFRSAHSQARDCVSFTTADFEALYLRLPKWQAGISVQHEGKSGSRRQALQW